MRIKSIVFAMAAVALIAPAAANAQTCVSAYEWCLNATWNTSGWTRLMANLECGATYAGCIRRAIM